MAILPCLSLMVWMVVNGFTWAHDNRPLFDADILFKPHESSVVQISVHESLDELTACFWLRLDPLPWPAGPVVFLNYSTQEKHDEVILEYQTSAFQFAVGNDTILTSNRYTQLDGSKWKFICVQWENKNGMTSLYINGNMLTNATNKQRNYKLANEDVRLELGYSATKDVSGRMTCVTLWEEFLSVQTILQLYQAQDCGSHLHDLIIDWQKMSESLRDKGSPLLVTPSQLRNDQVLATTTCTKPQLLHGQIFPESSLRGHVISTIEVLSELQCQDKCLRAQACDAYNIEQHATAIVKTCQLISGVTGASVNHVSHGRMLNRQSMHKALLVPCSETKEETGPTPRK